MTDPRRSRILIHLLMVSALGGTLLAIGVATVFAANGTVEATGSLGTYDWTPETVNINAGETVEIKNTQANPHGVTWDVGDPETPSCPGVQTTADGELGRDMHLRRTRANTSFTAPSIRSK